MKRWRVHGIENILTPEAIEAILTKEAILRAGIAPSKGTIISSNMPHSYAIHHPSAWTDSATEHLHQPVDDDSARLTMFASEYVLRQEWDSPEEDEAWAHL